jgi:hypothetical protein
MRHLVWLSGVLLALSCSVDNSNLNVDAGNVGTGGAGGCPRCAPTGGSGGAAAGATGTGGSVTGTGGSVSGIGGQSGAGGSVSGAGGSGTGGNVTGTGGDGAGGKGSGGATGTGGKGSGGTTGTGGKGSGGTTGTGGQGGSPSCDTLASEYTSALTKAKACTPGTANQCQRMVDSSITCPGCKTYVNDTTTLDTIDAQWKAAGCDKMHFICPAIACVVPGQPTCQAAAPGGSTGTCTSIATPVGTN